MSSSPPPQWKDRNVKRCSGLGKHHSRRERQTKEELQWMESKDHKKTHHSAAAPATTQHGMYYSPHFYHIKQWSHAAKQPLSCNVSKKSLHSIGLVRVCLLLFRSDYTVLCCLQLASKICVMVKYLKVIQLSEIASFCQKINGIPLCCLSQQNLVVVFFSLERVFLK